MKCKLVDLTDKAGWYQYLEMMEGRDIYFTPEYFELYERKGEGKARLFLFENGDEFVYYPFLLREINGIITEEMTREYGELYDITTPYGYGGPITNVKDASKRKLLFKEFDQSFRLFCRENNIITEFVRFHPFIGNDQDYIGVNSTLNRHTVYVDLSLDLDAIWANYDNKNRNRLRKAFKNEYFTMVHQPIDNFETFLSLYYRTMNKKQANDYYYFEREFFHHNIELLGEHLELIEVVMEDKVILSCFFMLYGDFIHYHLLGSDEQYLNFSPNNSLIHYAVEWGKARGKKVLHLGGGYTGDDDTLYRFKKRFNKYGDLPFYIGKRIHHEGIYKKLVEGLSVEGDYFPLYRHPDLLVNSR